jgi:hypothetical protein
MKDKLMAEVSVLERAAKDESIEIDLDKVRTTMFDAAQRIETLEKDVSEKDSKVAELTPLSEIGTRKINEVKEDTLRLLGVICEHTETKDMGRRDRMKERFEKETLDFAAIERYHADAQAEFDTLFPAEGKAQGTKIEEERATDIETVDVSAFKFKK